MHRLRLLIQREGMAINASQALEGSPLSMDLSHNAGFKYICKLCLHRFRSFVIYLSLVNIPMLCAT